jgi:hypothetical protein
MHFECFEYCTNLLVNMLFWGGGRFWPWKYSSLAGVSLAFLFWEGFAREDLIKRLLLEGCRVAIIQKICDCGA